MNNNESLATKCGRFLGHLMVACISVCATSVLVALTVRFIMWLIGI